jgi:hypothetical protein
MGSDTFPKQGPYWHSTKKVIHGSDTFMLGTNVTRIQIFPKQGALLHIPFKSGFMVQTPFVLGTNVTRILL